jgi:lipid-A-disaccharide synthase-like uncharacterized protein
MTMFPARTPDVARTGITALAVLGAIILVERVSSAGHGRGWSPTSAAGGAMIAIAAALWILQWVKRDVPPTARPFLTVYAFAVGCLGVGCVALYSGISKGDPVSVVFGVGGLLSSVVWLTIVTRAKIRSHPAETKPEQPDLPEC